MGSVAIVTIFFYNCSSDESYNKRVAYKSGCFSTALNPQKVILEEY